MDLLVPVWVFGSNRRLTQLPCCVASYPVGAQVQVSTSAFYAWAKAPTSTTKQDRENQLEAKTLDLFEKNRKTYGSRRLSTAFKDEGIHWGAIRRGV